MRDLAIISGSSNVGFAEKVAQSLGVKLTPTMTEAFGNGEVRVEILENVRDKDVFVIQSSSNTPNRHLMELFLLLDALKRANCYRVITVLPNYPYARQDRKVKSRVPISARVVADLVQSVGCDRILTTELHSPQIAGFFNIPVDNLYSSPVFLDFIRQRHPDNNICMCAPDAGSVKRAKMYAGRLGADVAMIYKHRSAPGEIHEMSLIGEVEGSKCIIMDDMADTCGTLIKATNVLLNNGAYSVEAYCTHAVLSGNALDALRDSNLDKLFVTDTICKSTSKDFVHHPKIEVLSIANLFGEAIQGIHEERSLSHLFDY